ncbi:hypothetical protein [Gilvibacter sediminis]|uniref:hypothetical protein n=1 Tax=Gilvibacter sediminis TaxID=379071 RepID=UPI002350EF2B|nr:hypothetical protein [Gilvibacter sediminis]MDC7997702.1 hypothetical protein [Gilvibacter sediminis]
MGWKIYTTFIKTKEKVEINNAFVRSLGFLNFDLTEKTEFIFGPKLGELFIGVYKDYLMIAHSTLSFEFEQESKTKTESKILSVFPDAEIINLHIGHILSFCVFENGRKVRRKSVGDEIFENTGELIEEELYWKNQQLINKEELDEITKQEYQIELENRLTYETCFELTKRVFGKRFDELDTEEYNHHGFKFVNKLMEIEKILGEKYKIKQFEE